MRVCQPCAKLIKSARRLAKRLGSVTLLPEHFMIAMLKKKNAATRFLRRIGVTFKKLHDACWKDIPRSVEHKGVEPCQSNSWNTVMGRAAVLAQSGRRNSIGIFDIFAAFTETNGIVECVFEACHVAYSAIRQFLTNLVKQEQEYAAPFAPSTT